MNKNNKRFKFKNVYCHPVVILSKLFYHVNRVIFKSTLTDNH